MHLILHKHNEGNLSKICTEKNPHNYIQYIIIKLVLNLSNANDMLIQYENNYIAIYRESFADFLLEVNIQCSVCALYSHL